MMTRSLTGLQLPAPSLRHALSMLISPINHLRRQAVYRKSVNDLNALDDRMLEDIGLDRADIKSKARKATMI